ncbi:MAG TPA: CapA family protein [Armatimonadota bacterium]|nr:CapA family protein [Armatimonadota bacterium]
MKHRSVALILGVCLLSISFLVPFFLHDGQQDAFTVPSQAAEEQATPPSITISLVGDVLLGAKVGNLVAARGMDCIFADVKSVFLADDVTIANFESAATTKGIPQEKQFVFRANPAYLPAVKSSGIDAVSLANNHALDYGRQALVDALPRFNDAHLTVAGAGMDIDAASKPAYVTTQGGTVALVAASRVLPDASWSAGAHQPGLASAYDPTRLYAAIRAAHTQADIVIVYLHWGVERAEMPAAYQRQLAHGCITAGADAVIGSHPHVLQGFEYYQGKLIAYSLGNFVFTNQGKSSAILQLTASKHHLNAVRVIPCLIDHYRPIRSISSQQRQQIIMLLQNRSFGVRITSDGTVSPG